MLAGEYDSSEFEQWIYNSKELEIRLNAEHYLAIIAIDFSKPASLSKAEQILRQYIDLGKHYERYISVVLQQIIERSPDVHIYIEQCYQLYCHGFTFLSDLALDYGLKIRVPPPNYSAENWYELTPAEQIELIESFYSDVAESAQRVLDWFSDR
ncbi:MAG: hypothetical protein AAFO95_07770 [Cyanobacteria bacterium J06600_6]